jgi:hypothetical protein
VKTGNYLLLPASTFEKVLTQFLINIVLGSILFVLLFYLDIHLARWTMQLKESVQSGSVVIEEFQVSMLYKGVGATNTFWGKLFFVMFIFSTGTFLFSVRLFFQRFALVKSIICGIGLLFFAFCLLVLYSHLFYPEKVEGFNLSLNDYEVCIGVTNYQMFVYTIFYFAWLFCLPLAYFKLKEKQL